MPIPSSTSELRPSDGPFLLTVVEEVFTISGRGTVITPAFPKGGSKFPIWTGDTIQLRRADGSSTETHIRGIEHLKRIKGGSNWGLLLPPEVTTADVPVGTAIWWMARAAQKSSE